MISLDTSVFVGWMLFAFLSGALLATLICLGILLAFSERVAEGRGIEPRRD